MEKKFVEFLLPGFLVSEPIEKPYKKGMPFPQGCFAYRLFTRKETMSDGEKLCGRNKYQEGMFYPKGSVITSARDVPSKYPGDGNRILRSNVEINNYPAIVKTPVGNIQPFYPKKDVVLPGNSVI